MATKRKGKIVVLHLAVRYPFAGVVWQLLHHLIGFRELGLDVYYVEDNRAWVYDPVVQAPVEDPRGNVKLIGGVLSRFGFGDRWSFYDQGRNEYMGMSREQTHRLLAESDALINLCGATHPTDEHRRNRCLVYLQTDPGRMQVDFERDTADASEIKSAHHLFFTYASNIGSDECRLPAGGVKWRPTRPPVLLDQWTSDAGAGGEPGRFTTVCTWHNKGEDVEIGGTKYFWSKDVNFREFLDVARLAGQPIEISTDLTSGPDYDRACAGGFSIVPVVPMSLDIDRYRDYVCSSRGEFTAAKDVYVRTRSGWFSDRSVCYLAAGRPVITQRTGFERYVPEGCGLMGFDNAEEAADAIRQVNSDYLAHCRAARAIASEYFAAGNLLGEIAEAVGL